MKCWLIQFLTGEPKQWSVFNWKLYAFADSAQEEMKAYRGQYRGMRFRVLSVIVPLD